MKRFKVNWFIAILAAVFMAAPCLGSVMTLPPPPPSEFADTEASTNLAVSLQTAGRSFFEVAILLQASSSNNLEVAFGCDANDDGGLSVEEQSLTLGWDSGYWFLRDESSGKRISVSRPAGTRRLDFCVMLNSDRHPCGLIAKDCGVVFQYNAKVIPSTLFNHDWNFARVTARGFRNANEHLSVGFAPAGFTVRLR